MPPPLDPDKRAAILADVQACVDGTHEQSAGSIARTHGVSTPTVTKLAKNEGLGQAWQREQTKRASESKATDNRARRVALSAVLLDDIERIRGKFFTPYNHVASTSTGIVMELLDEPPADALRNLVTAVAVLIDKHVALEKVDSDQGAADGRSAIEAFMEAARKAADR